MRRVAVLRGRSIRAPSARVCKGWVALLLCAVLVLVSTLLVAGLHRSTLQREQVWRLHWDRLQAQALGHGGLMWTLARLEDPRAVDHRCQATSTPATAATFADRMARPGMRVRCVIRLAPSGESVDPWACECPATTPSAPEPAEPPSVQAVIDIAFDGAPEALALHIDTRIDEGRGHPTVWQESVNLRRDESRLWRVVVGSWWDGR